MLYPDPCVLCSADLNNCDEFAVFKYRLPDLKQGFCHPACADRWERFQIALDQALRRAGSVGEVEWPPIDPVLPFLVQPGEGGAYTDDERLWEPCDRAWSRSPQFAGRYLAVRVSYRPGE